MTDKDTSIAVRQYHSIDQTDPKHEEFLREIADRYANSKSDRIEVRYRQVCIPYAPPITSAVDKQYVSNDVLVEVIVNNRLVALEYQRRDDGNYTETTDVALV